MKRLARKFLMGNTPFSEYARVTISGDISEKMYLEAGGKKIEVSQCHWLLCIEPIIFGIWLEKKTVDEMLPQASLFRLYVGSDKQPEATMDLEYFNKIDDQHGTLLLLKLQKSRIFHLSAVKNFLIYYRYYTRNNMSFARFKSHVCAYSYPRRIRLVSIKDGDYYNIFPMDLLGEIPGRRKFVFGLRHTNIALKRIVESRKIVVAEIPFAYKDIIFQLGKHHSSNAPAISDLPFQVITSKHFGFYIPAWTESYKEITIEQSQNLGSHMLLWGEIEEENFVNPPGSHLYMVHFLHFLFKKNHGTPYQRL